tara:strand:- start:1036 stop:1440 length:405 start_codon:yes stop_codon:yes gene_type:complete
MKNSNTVKSIVYFNDRCDSLFILKPPGNPELHHKIFMIAGAMLETQMNTFFILPLLIFILTSSFMMNSEFKSRLIIQCLDFENDETGELPNDIIFDHSKDIILGQGFMVYRTIITTKYIMYSILIYYATLGLLI